MDDRDDLGLIPRPKSVRRLPGTARGVLELKAGPECAEAAAVYAECGAELMGVGHSGTGDAGSGEVRIPVYLSLRKPPPPAGDQGPEAYRLGVAGDGGIEVRAGSHAGLVYGIHTLLYLARPRVRAAARWSFRPA